MASSSSCSHWWHAPIYITATVALILAAISSSSSPQDDHQDQESGGGDLILALHLSGFHLTAHHLLRSSLHLSSFTLFALPDPFLSDSDDAELLLLRHVIPLQRLPFASLPPTAASFPTLLPRLNLSFDPSLVSRPDLFVRGPHVAHGLSRPFPPHPLLFSDPALRLLRSKGYASFSRSLGALEYSRCTRHDKMNATVFAAREWGAGLDARRHVAAGRYGFREVRAMEVGEAMEGLCGETNENDDDWGNHNIIRVTDHGGAIKVNGVEIVEPEVYVDDRIVVHGIARAFVPWPGDDDDSFFE